MSECRFDPKPTIGNETIEPGSQSSVERPSLEEQDCTGIGPFSILKSTLCDVVADCEHPFIFIRLMNRFGRRKCACGHRPGQFLLAACLKHPAKLFEPFLDTPG